MVAHYMFSGTWNPVKNTKYIPSNQHKHNWIYIKNDRHSDTIYVFAWTVKVA